MYTDLISISVLEIITHKNIFRNVKLMQMLPLIFFLKKR